MNGPKGGYSRRMTIWEVSVTERWPLKSGTSHGPVIRSWVYCNRTET